MTEVTQILFLHLDKHEAFLNLMLKLEVEGLGQKLCLKGA